MEEGYCLLVGHRLQSGPDVFKHTFVGFFHCHGDITSLNCIGLSCTEF